MEQQELVTLRSFFYTGNHQKVLAEAKSLSGLDKRGTVLRDILVARSLIGQGKYKEVFALIDKNAAAALQAARLLATYLSAADEQKEMAFETLREWMTDSCIASDPAVQLLSAQIYLEAQNYKEALKLVVQSDALEM